MQITNSDVVICMHSTPVNDLTAMQMPWQCVYMHRTARPCSGQRAQGEGQRRTTGGHCPRRLQQVRCATPLYYTHNQQCLSGGLLQYLPYNTPLRIMTGDNLHEG